jgi:hypothetical protein
VRAFNHQRLAGCDLNVLRASFISLILLPLVACGVSPGGAAAGYEGAAQTAARAWLGYIDTGNYGESWETAATWFRASVTREQWEARVRTIQEPLGSPLSRELIAAKYTNRPPVGYPAGEYVVAQYRTIFAEDRRIIETLAMVRGENRWSTAQYLIAFR